MNGFPTRPRRADRPNLRSRVLLGVFGAAAAWVALGSVAYADEDSDAEKHFTQGLSFAKDENYESAMIEFKRAYEIKPDYRVLYNLGLTSRELKDFASALKAFRQYLEEGGQAIDKARKNKVAGFISEAESKVGTAAITCNVEGADITVDDLEVGKTPLAEPLLVNAGRRRIGVHKPGYVSSRRVVDFAANDETEVTLTLEKETKTERVDQKDTPPPPPKEIPKEPIVPIGAAFAMLGVTGASALGLGIVGGLALSKEAELEEQLGVFPGNAAKLDATRSSLETLTLTSDILLGVTIASGLTTGVLFVLTGVEQPVEVSVGPQTLTVSGRF